MTKSETAPTTMATVSIGVIGPGLVGKDLLRQLAECIPKWYSSPKGRVNLRVAAVCNSKRMLLFGKENKTDMFDFNTYEEKLLSCENTSIAGPVDFKTMAGHVSKDGKAILVDCSSSDFVASHYPAWLEAGINVVTPNKKGVSGDMDLYKSIKSACAQKRVEFKHEATVGAGLPIISTLQNLVNTGDKIVRIEGIFSGTLSYIFNTFSTPSSNKPDSFSKIVQVAKESGFTEPDPRDDLNGMDVARKVTILGRVAGLELLLENLKVENVVPEKLRDCASAEEFMAKLPEYDAHFSDLNAKANKEGKVLRYVGVVEPNGDSVVELRMYPFSHPFANLKGSDNIISFTTERYPNPLIVQGAGAGAAVTAAGIFGDILAAATVVS
eukprot:Nk52_evm85s914 gene=Nk52_evmTU85s914